MKKLIIIFAAIAMLAVSCQKENIINDENTGITTGKLTATIMAGTKVSYTMMEYDDDWNWNYGYDEWDYEYGLLPAWEVGDEIIGFDDDGKTYTLTVDSIDAGTATLSGTVPDGDLHLIYKYGAQASDISAKTLTVDYSGQAGDKTMPAVMLADGTVDGGECEFTFTNAGAVISVWFAEGLELGSEVTKITLSGENLSKATIALDGGALTLTATPNDDDAISVDGLDLTVVDDDWGSVLSDQILIAVPDGAVIEMVTLTVPTLIESTSMRIPSTTSDYVTIGGKKWAKWNIGATSETDYGWYFPWGGTEGYFHNKNAWLYDGITSYDFKYSYYKPDEAYEASAGTHCLSGSDGPFQLEAQVTSTFDWEKAPFNNGNTDTDNTYFSSIRNTVCPGDILASDYDAAHVNWGGTWRMPTRDDFKALIDACGGAGGTCSPTPLASATPGQGIYWVSEVQTYIEDYTGVAGFLFCDGTSKLFFPAAGQGAGSALSNAGNNGYYWSSSLYPSTTAWGNAYCMSLSYYTAKMDFTIRSRGYPIRPVSD